MKFMVSSVRSLNRTGVDPIQNPVYMMGKQARPFNNSGTKPMPEADFRNDAEPAPALAEAQPKRLTPAARRALEEAETRRQAYREREAALPKELGGRGGKEPGRYGDWEVKGLATDF
jgi:hypothetical protein